MYTGYLTEDYLWSTYQKFIDANPEVDVAKYREQHQLSWNVLFNSGKQVSKGEGTATYLICKCIEAEVIKL